MVGNRISVLRLVGACATAVEGISSVTQVAVAQWEAFSCNSKESFLQVIEGHLGNLPIVACLWALLLAVQVFTLRSWHFDWLHGVAIGVVFLLLATDIDVTRQTIFETLPWIFSQPPGKGDIYCAPYDNSGLGVSMVALFVIAPLVFIFLIMVALDFIYPRNPDPEV